MKNAPVFGSWKGLGWPQLAAFVLGAMAHSLALSSDERAVDWFSLKPGTSMAAAAAMFPKLRKVDCPEGGEKSAQAYGWTCERYVLDDVALGSVRFKGQIRSTTSGTIGLVRLYGVVLGTIASERMHGNAIRHCSDTLEALQAIFGPGSELSRIMAPQRVNYTVQYAGKGGMASVMLSCVQSKEPDAIHITVTALTQTALSSAPVQPPRATSSRTGQAGVRAEGAETLGNESRSRAAVFEKAIMPRGASASPSTR